MVVASRSCFEFLISSYCWVCLKSTVSFNFSSFYWLSFEAALLSVIAAFCCVLSRVQSAFTLCFLPSFVLCAAISFVSCLSATFFCRLLGFTSNS